MEDYIVIPKSIARLELTASERIALSLVYGFSREEQGVFYGTYEYIASWLGSTKRTAINVMKDLESKGYLEKGTIVKGDRILNYWGVKKFHPGEKISPIDNNIDIHSNSNINTKSSISISLSKERLEKEISLPYTSPKFLETWAELTTQPKWKGKSKTALRKCAELLAKYTEEVALQMMDNSIMNGWQGLFPPKDRPAPQRATPTASSLAAARESFQRIADRHRTTAEQETQYLPDYDN